MMNIQRRQLVLGGACTLAYTAFSPLARAARFPSSPMHLIVPFAPGGNVDATARVVSAGLTSTLGEAAVVENRPGAGGTIGAETVVRAEPDGYTLLVGSNGPLTINPFVQAGLPYDPLKDFASIGMVGYVPHVLAVNPKLPVKTLEDLVKLSQTRHVTVGNSGVGSATHLSTMRFNAVSGAKLVPVPYRGGGALLADVVGGSLDATMTEFSTALPLHQAGKLRILALASDHRSALAPDIPTMSESGVKGFTSSSYVGLLAPVKTPKTVIATLNQGLVKALEDPKIASKLRDFGLEAATPEQRTAQGFEAFLQQDYQSSKAAAKLAGLTPT